MQQAAPGATLDATPGATPGGGDRVTPVRIIDIEGITAMLNRFFRAISAPRGGRGQRPVHGLPAAPNHAGHRLDQRLCQHRVRGRVIVELSFGLVRQRRDLLLYTNGLHGISRLIG